MSDSLGKRYLFKLGSNLATVPLYLVMEAVLPRALGPAAYGNFNFSTALFQNFTNFLDMGTSTCLNTALAKRPAEAPALAAFYARVALLVLLLCLLAGAALSMPGAGGLLMPGVPLWLALPAALWAYVTWAGRVGRGMNDALGHTVSGEPVRIGVNLLSAAALVGLFAAGCLSLPVLFAHQYVFLSLMAAGFVYVMRRDIGIGGFDGVKSAGSGRLDPEKARAYRREFRRYSAPLFALALCSALALSAERWLLQYFDGSVQQGYFSLAQRVGVACFLFVTALTPLLTRELAVAHGKNDPGEMARLLDAFAPKIYALSAWMACFALAEAPAVARLFGGEAFGGAVLPLQIMALYPVHQGYGQVAGAVFYATGQTRRLRNISLVWMAGGLVAVFFLLAPPENAGLGLGAAGLALKMVAVQILSVNALFFACRKTVPFAFGRNLLHQLYCPLAFATLAFGARFATEALGGAPSSLPRFVASGALYCLFCALTLPLLPPLAGLRRGELGSQFARLRRWLGR